MLKFTNIAALALLGAIAANTVNAADKVAEQGNTVATVNKIAIPQARMALAQQGQPDSPELREKIRNELIDLEVIAQEAAKKNLDKQAEAAQILELTRQNILRKIFLQDYVKSHPVTEDAVKQAYENAKKEALGTNQYKIAHIIVENKKEADAILAKIKNNGKFEKLAKEKSLDPQSKENGGEIGWVFPSRLPPALSEAILKLKKGQVSAPVQNQYGWSIYKLNDVRDFPPFEEVKVSIQMDIQNKNLQELIKTLRANAEVVKN